MAGVGLCISPAPGRCWRAECGCGHLMIALMSAVAPTSLSVQVRWINIQGLSWEIVSELARRCAPACTRSQKAPAVLERLPFIL